MKFFLPISILSTVFWHIKSQDNEFPICPLDRHMGPYRPEANSTDFFCDCFYQYLYFPETDSCYEAYYRGPCSHGQYLVLSPEEELSRCEENYCRENGVVLFEGSCIQLRTRCDFTNKDLVLLVDADFQLTCTGTGSIGGRVIDAPVRKCTKGSRRNALGMCKLEFN